MQTQKKENLTLTDMPNNKCKWNGMMEFENHFFPTMVINDSCRHH